MVTSGTLSAPAEEAPPHLGAAGVSGATRSLHKTSLPHNTTDHFLSLTELQTSFVYADVTASPISLLFNLANFILGIPVSRPGATLRGAA